jgi:hypothetical protein
MFKTKNDLSEEIRAKVVETLQDVRNQGFSKAWPVIRKCVDESAFAQPVEATIRLMAGLQADSRTR